MKKLVLTFVLIILATSFVYSQTFIDKFDSTEPDSIYWSAREGNPSRINLSLESSDFVEGTGALKVDGVIGAFHPWGSFIQFGYTVPDSVPPMDWSISDSMSIWIKVLEAPKQPEYMVFRIQIADQPSAEANKEQYIYENAVIVDAVSDWVELKLPIFERETDGTTVPNDEGFVLAPTTWGGFAYNNRVLDRDKIVEWNIGLITTGWTDPQNIPEDSLVVLLDNFTRFGSRAIPFVFFNGKTIPSGISTWSWGQSSFNLEEGAGATPSTNALKWIQGNEWGNGWTGVGMTMDPPYNMAGVWSTDSLKFKMKAEEGVGPIRVQFEDGSAKVGTVFQPVTDNEWHSYAFKLNEMVYQDGTSNFDSSKVSVFGVMAEASAIAGKVIYMDDIWTGTPDIDVVAPLAPTGLGALASDYYNLIYWQDVPGENGETYSVYASTEPITDLTSNKVDIVATGVLEGIQSVAHWLIYPLQSADVTYYYAVTCMDEAGNNSETFATTSSAVANVARGIPVINTPPANFVADGDFGEWEAAGIIPYVMTPENYFVSVGTVTDATDLTGTVYLAMDDDFIYIGADVIDDVYHFGDGNWWDQDAFEVFIGLYDQRGPKHSSPERGEEPDYKLVMDQNSCREDFAGGTFYTPDDENYYIENFSGQDYVIETKISLDSLLGVTDKRFHPVRGQRIPLEITFHDNDGNGWEGNLVTSPVNSDNAHSTPSVWSNTWVGDTTEVATDVEMNQTKQVLESYTLSQNYPNPFNPTTTISYSIAKPGLVKVVVYNVVGQEVKTLVNKYHTAGVYTTQLNAKDMPSGVYFYQIEANNFKKTMKMVLMK